MHIEIECFPIERKNMAWTKKKGTPRREGTSSHAHTILLNFRAFYVISDIVVPALKINNNK